MPLDFIILSFSWCTFTSFQRTVVATSPRRHLLPPTTSRTFSTNFGGWGCPFFTRVGGCRWRHGYAPELAARTRTRWIRLVEACCAASYQVDPVGHRPRCRHARRHRGEKEVGRFASVGRRRRKGQLTFSTNFGGWGVPIFHEGGRLPSAPWIYTSELAARPCIRWIRLVQAAESTEV